MREAASQQRPHGGRPGGLNIPTSLSSLTPPPARTSHWLIPRATWRHGSLLMQTLPSVLAGGAGLQGRQEASKCYLSFLLLFHVWGGDSAPAAHLSPRIIFSLSCRQPLPPHHLLPSNAAFCSSCSHLKTATINRPSSPCVSPFSVLKETTVKTQGRVDVSQAKSAFQARKIMVSAKFLMRDKQGSVWLTPGERGSRRDWGLARSRITQALWISGTTLDFIPRTRGSWSCPYGCLTSHPRI